MRVTLLDGKVSMGAGRSCLRSQVAQAPLTWQPRPYPLAAQVGRLHATLRPHLLRRVIKDVEKVRGQVLALRTRLAAHLIALAAGCTQP